MGIALPATAGAAEDVEPPAEPLPDPLTLPPAPTPSRSGYIESGGVPSSLLAPTRWRVGDFALSSRAALSLLYDDNIEADDEVRDEDVFLTFSPAVQARSLYARHSIGVGASATAANAFNHGSEDVFDWRVGADGRLDISRQTKINAALGYSRDTEDDEAIDAEDDEDDLPIHLIDAALEYTFNGDAVGWRLGSIASRLDAEDREFDDRDRTTLGLDAAASYRFSDRLSISAGPSYRYSSFDEEVADDGDSRDAQIVSAQVGAGYKISRTIDSSAAIGYSYAIFDDPDREDKDTTTGHIGLNWDAGYGTSLELRASRTLGLTVIDDEDSRTTTTGAATLSHQLNLGSRSAITSSLSFSISELSDLDRTDQNFIAALGYAYRLTEHTFFNAGYRFSRRDSDDEEADYYRNLVSIGVTVAY